MIKVGSKVRWKKVAGKRINALAFLAMGDVLMEVIKRHPTIGFKGQPLWLVRGPDGHEDWVPEDEIWEIYE